MAHLSRNEPEMLHVMVKRHGISKNNLLLSLSIGNEMAFGIYGFTV